MRAARSLAESPEVDVIIYCHAVVWVVVAIYHQLAGFAQQAMAIAL